MTPSPTPLIFTPKLESVIHNQIETYELLKKLEVSVDLLWARLGRIAKKEDDVEPLSI